MKLVLDPAAKAEMRQAALFYEECREGLGHEFLDAVESAFDQIRRHPTLWRIMKGQFRRYLVHQFDLCGRGKNHLYCSCDAPQTQTWLLGIERKSQIGPRAR